MTKALNVNDLMEFDHVIEVHPDGTVTDASGVYAPELDAENDAVSEGWELLTGYTGQYGYNGPMMHDSEYIGGRMERDILARPGYYVALVGTFMHSPDCPAPDTDHKILHTVCHYPEESYLEGWAVAYRPVFTLEDLQRLSVSVTVTVTKTEFPGDNEENFDPENVTSKSYEFSAENDYDYEGATASEFVADIVQCFKDEGAEFSAVDSDIMQARWAAPHDSYVHSGVVESVTVTYDMTYNPTQGEDAVRVTDSLTAAIRKAVN